MPKSCASCGLRIVVGWPLIWMVPSSGISAPDRIFTRVDLPAPLSPTSAMISFSRTSSETPLRARLPQHALTMPEDLSRDVPLTAGRDGASTWFMLLGPNLLHHLDPRLVDHHRENEEAPEHDQLLIARHAQQVHAVGDERHEERAQHDVAHP